VTRTRLLDAAARMLVAQEPLSLRRLAAEVGTSTMSVYTHFGGIDELMREVRREGFGRLADHLATVPTTRDPVADLAALGWAYCLNAVENPHLYRAMFFETTADMREAAAAATTFIPVVHAVERAIAAGRLRLDEAWDAAVELWALAHGAVSLALGGMLTADDLLRHLEHGIGACLVGFGDEATNTARSLRAARRRMMPSEGLPALTTGGATLADATEAARDSS
jgi:AcrR family transcriptional regulator